MFCALPKKCGTSKDEFMHLVTVSFGKCFVSLPSPVHNSLTDSVSAFAKNLLDKTIRWCSE